MEEQTLLNTPINRLSVADRAKALQIVGDYVRQLYEELHALDNDCFTCLHNDNIRAEACWICKECNMWMPMKENKDD